MTRGSYTRDFYFIPTILYHNGDGIYRTIEIAWLKWYIGIAWTPYQKGGKVLEQITAEIYEHFMTIDGNVHDKSAIKCMEIIGKYK